MKIGVQIIEIFILRIFKILKFECQFFMILNGSYSDPQYTKMDNVLTYYRVFGGALSIGNGLGAHRTFFQQKFQDTYVEGDTCRRDRGDKGDRGR